MLYRKDPPRDGIKPVSFKNLLNCYLFHIPLNIVRTMICWRKKEKMFIVYFADENSSDGIWLVINTGQALILSKTESLNISSRCNLPGQFLTSNPFQYLVLVYFSVHIFMYYNEIFFPSLSYHWVIKKAPL